MYIGRDKQKAALSLAIRKSRESNLKSSISDGSCDSYELNSPILALNHSPEKENRFSITDELQKLTINNGILCKVCGKSTESTVVAKIHFSMCLKRWAEDNLQLQEEIMNAIDASDQKGKTRRRLFSAAANRMIAAALDPRLAKIVRSNRKIGNGSKNHKLDEACLSDTFEKFCEVVSGELKNPASRLGATDQCDFLLSCALRLRVKQLVELNKTADYIQTVDLVETLFFADK